VTVANVLAHTAGQKDESAVGQVESGWLPPVVSPVIVDRTKKAASDIVLESTISLYAWRQWRQRILEERDDPADNRWFQVGGIIPSGTTSPFAQLEQISECDSKTSEATLHLERVCSVEEHQDLLVWPRSQGHVGQVDCSHDMCGSGCR
jgi:hypothetical protein